MFKFRFASFFFFVFVIIGCCTISCKPNSQDKENTSVVSESEKAKANDVNKTTAQPASIQLKDDQENVLRMGEIAYVEEYENASTGASWMMIHQPDSTIFKIVDTAYTSEGNDPNEVGAGGMVRWTYQAIKPGKDSLVMWYGRSWEDRQPDNPPVRFMIEVKN